MKNKNLVIAAIVIVLILLLGATGFIMLNKKGAANPKATAENSTTKMQPQATAKSLLDLVKAGQNVRCTFKTVVKNGSTDGTVYVSGQNIRADFSVTSDGKTQQTSMIKNGDTSYLWGDVLKMGIKITMPLDQLTQNTKNMQQSLDPNQKVDYTCSPWNVDTSLFTVPTNIKFTDMTSLVAPKTTGAVTAPQTQTQTGNSTDPCNQIANPTAKAACESALKQNGY